MNYGYFCGVLYCGMCGGKYTTFNILNVSANGVEVPNISYRCNQKARFGEVSCNSPDINHAEMERVFYKYVQNINDISTDYTVDFAESEKKLDTLKNRKSQIMEQYVKGIIDFDEYKNMIELFNKNFGVAKNELQIKNERFLHKDIIQSLKRNWKYLGNTDKSIFIQRFIKSITITASSSMVKVNSVEFLTGERSKNELQKCEPPRRGSVRKILRER